MSVLEIAAQSFELNWTIWGEWHDEIVHPIHRKRVFERTAVLVHPHLKCGGGRASLIFQL
ncbi:hypothetical protein ABE85_16500 [Mitsuaria sp. 7]|nr:hypothetical protein ABE85_16500 [Mitsuaria sp. 7]